MQLEENNDHESTNDNMSYNNHHDEDTPDSIVVRRESDVDANTATSELASTTSSQIRNQVKV